MKHKQLSIAFYTLIKHEITRMFRIAGQAFLPPVITMTLYFVIFGRVMGQQIGTIHGVSYATFIAPGLVMMGVINNSYMNVSASFFLMRFAHSIEELLICPMPNWMIMLGFVIGGTIRGLIIAIIILMISLFFIPFAIHNIAVIIFITTLTAVLFSLAGFTNGLLAKNFDDISVVPTFILTPLIYLGGVFYSPTLLPPFWHKISLLNPIWYLVDTFRYGIIGVSDVKPILAISIVLSFTSALLIANLVMMNKGIGLKK